MKNWGWLVVVLVVFVTVPLWAIAIQIVALNKNLDAVETRLGNIEDRLDGTLTVTIER